MPSKDIYNKLNKANLIPKNDFYNRFDSLASEQDFTFLFEILTSVKDKNKNHPILTANTIIANPDFKKIKNSDFTEYHFEEFTDTLKKYPNHINSFKLWKEGIDNKLFYPQFHGREHVNIFRWLRSLQNNENNSRLAFENEIFGLKKFTSRGLRDGYMRALDFENLNQFRIIEESLTEGLEIFKNKFGYHSKSFIAPSYVWDKKVEKVLFKNGIKYLQGISYQHFPKEGKVDLKKKYNYTGKKNKLNQRYLVRNVFFEPTLTGSNQPIEEALKRIEIAFKYNKPAIIGSHRLNYIGFISSKNRDKNLILFKDLLKRIVKKWPEVEFMTSDQLGDLIANNRI